MFVYTYVVDKFMLLKFTFCSIKVEALYYIRDGQMVTDAFAAVTEVVTPADPSIDHCTG